MTEPTPLDKLAYDLEMAKQVEANANAARIEVEGKILDLVEIKKDGSKTYNENFYKVVVKEPVNRTVDLEVYKKLGLKLGQKDPVLMKPSLDTKKYKALGEFDPKLFKKFQKCVTSKPGKVQVSVERRADVSRPTT